MSEKSKRSNHIGIIKLYENKKLKRSLKMYRNKVYSCGRDSECALPIQGNQYISSTHFKFWCTQFDSTYDPVVYVQDKSLNGTMILEAKGNCLKKIQKDKIVVIKDKTCLYFPHEVQTIDSINKSVMMFKFIIEKKKISNKENDHELSQLLNSIKHNKLFKERWMFNNTFFGSGSFGVVCGCLDLKNNQALNVCKIIKDTIVPIEDVDEQVFCSAYKKIHGKTPLLLNKVKKERQIMQNLNHPNIVKYISCLTTETTSFDTLDNGDEFTKVNVLLFQEQAYGGDLFSYLLDAKKLVLRSLPEAESLLIVYQIMLALEYLHSRNLAHRDLKLDNILLETPEKLSRVMLTDFGIAKEKCLRMKTCIGTPEYSAPEVGNFHKNTMRDVIQNKLSQGNKKNGYDTKCDIWSLGIIFYYLLTGQPFFEKKYEDDILKRFEEYTLEDLQEWIDDKISRLKEENLVSNECVLFLKKMITIDESNRYDIEDCFQDEYIKNHKKSLESIYKGILNNSQHEEDMTMGNMSKKMKKMK